MKKYAVIQLNRDGSDELLEVSTASNIKEARKNATTKYIQIVTDIRNHKLMVIGYKAYEEEMNRRTGK